MIAHDRWKEPAAARFWEQHGLSAHFLTLFWKRLWTCKQEHKITLLQWMTSHRVVPVGSWLRGASRRRGCPYCGHSEIVKHAFWGSQAGKQV